MAGASGAGKMDDIKYCVQEDITDVVPNMMVKQLGCKLSVLVCKCDSV